MDEPTEGLAPVVVQGIGRLIVELKKTGVAIVLAEQNHHLALKVADRAVFMEKGRIVEEMPAAAAATSKVLERVRTRATPHPRCRPQRDDPLDPPESAHAGCDQAHRVPVAPGQVGSADAG